MKNDFIERLKFALEKFFCLGCEKAVKMLINRGARMNIVNVYGFSALDYAANATEGKFWRKTLWLSFSLDRFPQILSSYGLLFLLFQVVKE